ncbi:hypothetical protein BJ742DRAFT_834640 [Cladochytrium replicatum]|nr:hypothetical protein BJ742DRAFT_834640 [Cladochytrium replicatum]
MAPHEGHTAAEGAPDGTGGFALFSSGLVLHVLFIIIAYFVLIPLGISAAAAKSRHHVPIQILAVIFATVGYVLGGRVPWQPSYAPNNPHMYTGFILIVLLFAQSAFGAIIKFTKPAGAGRSSRFSPNFRATVRSAHKWLGWAHFFLPYVQAVFGVIEATTACQGDSIGNCLAHFIMGSFFLLYGSIMITQTLLGWKSPVRQDLIDSIIITVWGTINTFTENPGMNKRWLHGDWQHTGEGVLFVGGGIASLVFSMFAARKSTNVAPVRNYFPALVIALTGVTMLMHSQHAEFGIIVHRWFGICLIIGATCRIIHLYIPTLGMELGTGTFFVLGGLLFQSANWDFLMWLGQGTSMDGVAYATFVTALGLFIIGYVGAWCGVHLWFKGGKRKEEQYETVALQGRASGSMDGQWLPVGTDEDDEEPSQRQPK